MNDIPLIQKADINSINTSIIAIKKQLKQLNEALGLVDVPSIDTSVFVKKSDVVDVVEAGNMNPVTSNAVAEVADSLEPVDEVTSGVYNPVTSNAVANSAFLKSDYENMVALCDATATGSRTLNDNLSKYSLVLIGVYVNISNSIRTSVQLLPVSVIKANNASGKSLITSMFSSTGAYFGVLWHYVDDTHIYIDNFDYSSYWNTNGGFLIRGIK